MDPREPLHADDDARLFERLADGGVGGLLARVHDARDRGQAAVVAPASEQQLAVSDDDSGDPDEGERAGADEAAQFEDEVGRRHAAHDSRRVAGPP